MGGGSAAELRESWSEFLEFPPVVPGARPAGAPAPFLPPAFTAHRVPPSVPGRHGAAASAQEVTNARSQEKEGGGARGLRRGLLGRAGPRPPPRQPCPVRARRASGGGIECWAASVHRLRAPRGGRASPLPRAGPGGVESRGAAPGSPRPDSRARRTFPSRQVHEARRWETGKQPCRRSCQMFVIILPFI